MGSFSLLAKFIPEMTVYSFEPYIDIFNILKNNIRFNNIEDRVLPFNIACSNIKGSSILKCCPKFSGMSCMGPNFKFDKCQIIEKSVITDTLDSIMYKINPLEINLIKIDTEGCEFFVIKGAEKLIRKFKPLIIAECVERRTVNFNYNHHEIIELLKSMGYKIEQISENDILAS
jgi:FkbM family methyltransferase